MSDPTQATLDPAAEEAIRADVREIVLELAPNPEGGSNDGARLIEELEFTSLALLELAFTLEDEYDLLPIDEETARGIQTLAQVQEHVLGELRERALEDAS